MSDDPTYQDTPTDDTNNPMPANDSSSLPDTADVASTDGESGSGDSNTGKLEGSDGPDAGTGQPSTGGDLGTDSASSDGVADAGTGSDPGGVPPSGPTASVKYDVEVIIQAQNPICWIASCAMLKGFGTKSSVGVGDFTGGFDPSNSSIPNLASSWGQCFDLMDSWGFSTAKTSDLGSGSMTGEALVNALRNQGPALLAHTCSGFPYGAKWAGVTLPPSAAHAVVITGVDVTADTATFNNPWGDKDVSCSLTTLLAKINGDQSHGKQFAFWPAS